MHYSAASLYKEECQQTHTVAVNGKVITDSLPPERAWPSKLHAWLSNYQKIEGLPFLRKIVETQELSRCEF